MLPSALARPYLQSQHYIQLPNFPCTRHHPILHWISPYKHDHEQRQPSRYPARQLPMDLSRPTLPSPRSSSLHPTAIPHRHSQPFWHSSSQTQQLRPALLAITTCRSTMPVHRVPRHDGRPRAQAKHLGILHQQRSHDAPLRALRRDRRFHLRRHLRRGLPSRIL